MQKSVRIGGATHSKVEATDIPGKLRRAAAASRRISRDLHET
jgi:hypothetical protein